MGRYHKTCKPIVFLSSFHLHSPFSQEEANPFLSLLLDMFYYESISHRSGRSQSSWAMLLWGLGPAAIGSTSRLSRTFRNVPGAFCWLTSFVRAQGHQEQNNLSYKTNPVRPLVKVTSWEGAGFIHRLRRPGILYLMYLLSIYAHVLESPFVEKYIQNLLQARNFV